MDGINNKPMSELGKVNLSNLSKSKGTKSSAEYTPKTGDLTQSMEYQGMGNRMLVKKSPKKEPVPDDLKDAEKYLKKHYSGAGKLTNEDIAEFNKLIDSIPLPTDPEVLDNISLDDYLKQEALKEFQKQK